MRRAVAITLLLGQSAGAATAGLELDAGSLGRWGAGKFAEFYLEPRFKHESGAFVGSFRARGRSNASTGAHSQVEIRDTYFQLGDGQWRASLGFQSLSWGETFGFFIADLPNPRDLSDPLLLDIAFIKKPVFMGHVQWFGESGSLQLYASPEQGRRQVGGRASRLWATGLDTSFFMIGDADARTWTAGLTGSQSLGDRWVVRTDQVFREQGTLDWQGVLGIDWSPEATFTLSGQIQRDPGLMGSSLRAAWRGLEDRWDLEAFAFLGFAAAEFWVQPKVTYNHPDGISISLRYDWVRTDPAKPGYFSLWGADASRALLWASYRY